MEGALLGIPSIAVSLVRTRQEYDFGPAAEAAARIADIVLANGLPSRVFLNVNVPAGTPRGFRTTFQAKRNHVTVVDSRLDPRGIPYYWIEEGQDDWEPHDRSDYRAVKDGYVSVTPLHPDLTAYEVMRNIEALVGDGVSPNPRA
jgi:5'-nucleotidase